MVDVSAEACLARARAFEKLDDEGRARLAALAQVVTFDEGEVLMREGDPGDGFYLLVRGLLRVEADDLEDQARRLATIEPGAVLGEIGVLTREPRTATVTAETPAEVLRFEMLAVLGVLKDYPEVAGMIERIRATLAGDRKALERVYHLDLQGSSERWTLVLVPLERSEATLARLMD